MLTDRDKAVMWEDRLLSYHLDEINKDRFQDEEEEWRGCPFGPGPECAACRLRRECEE